jgi:guanine deaminase
MSTEKTMLLVEGPVVHAVEFGRVEILSHAFILVDQSCGRIVSVSAGRPVMDQEAKLTHLLLKPNQFTCPGFIDTHYHAPQTENMGLGLDYTLLEWLDRVTFPRERSYSTRTEADICHEYNAMVRRLLSSGTTTCVYFGSLQAAANKILAKSVHSAGQRAFIGKVCMDQNSPPEYCESDAENVAGTLELIDAIQKISPDRLVQPIVTPRFAPTCSEGLMRQLGALAKDTSLPIQTHISENKGEVEWVHSLFPDKTGYAAVYDSAGLLTPKTILAHAIYLTDPEKALIKERSCTVSHCPNSNFSLTSGVLNLRDLLSRGIKVALGTDMSGGYSSSMLDACRQAIIASKCIHFGDAACKPLSVDEAFSLATICGAQALDAKELLGNFAPNKLFDALVIDLSLNPQIAHSPISGDPAVSLRAAFEKFIFCGDDRCIERVFVNGKQVQSALPLHSAPKQ